MAEKAQELLAGSGWLPEPLRTPGQVFGAVPDATVTGSAGVEAEQVIGNDESSADAHDQVEPDADVVANEEAWPTAAE